MQIDSLLRDGIWVREVISGKEAWERYTDHFYNSGAGACMHYLTVERNMYVYGSPHTDRWTVWCQGQGDADAPLVEWLSCETYGRTLPEAIAVAAGLLHGISRGEIDYALSTEREGVATACV